MNEIVPQGGGIMLNADLGRPEANAAEPLEKDQR